MGWPLRRSGARDARQGASEHPVRTLQHLLRQRGSTIAVDGVFGPRTDEAVRALRRGANLAVDGIVGPRTWRALVSGMLSF